jgi:hypothetical protein
MKRSFILILPAVMISLASVAQGRLVHTGEVPGYVTLKCDFHIHTVFSDGDVWPGVRLDEAEREGLDAIAITDHIEYQPKKEYIPVDLDAAWKILRDDAARRDILLVHGAEITRRMPPGHFNALFIDHASALTDKDFLAVVGEAVRQGAFIQWNHPGWKAQRPAGDTHLDSIHRVLLEKGWLNGVELCNDVESYRGVLPLCLEKRLAVMANSDIHGPFAGDYYPGATHRRPVTLVFARERSVNALKEALMAGRTLAWFADTLAGSREYALPFVTGCLAVGKVSHRDEKYTWRRIVNTSDIPYEITLKSTSEKEKPRKFSLPAQGTYTLRLPAGVDLPLTVTVTNVLVNDGLPLELELRPAP